MKLTPLVVGPIETNCYIVGAASGDGLIIDPGGDGKKILRTVKEQQLDIKLVVLTHGHFDHTGALKEVKEATGAPVAVHSLDAEQVSRPGPLGMLMNHSVSKPPAPERLLKGGDSVDIGELRFLVLHTPGHSPGGICLYGHGVVFSGDTLFNYGIGRTDIPGGSYRQLMDSIHTKLMVLPDDTKVYPGHGPDSTIGAERRGNPFLRG